MQPRLAGMTWMLVLIPGCSEQATPGLTSAEALHVSALCRTYERCAEDWGRLWVSEAACVEVIRERLARHIAEVSRRHAPDEAVLACTARLEDSPCEELYARRPDVGWLYYLPEDVLGPPVPFASEEDSCGELQEAWSEPNKRSYSASGPGEECGAEQVGCQEGSSCRGEPEFGDACALCVLDAGQGQACDLASCAEGLYCDPDLRCVPIESKACQEDLDCSRFGGYDCGPEWLCTPIPVGYACTNEQYLGKLTCIAGLTAVQSQEGGPCDDTGDCGGLALSCLDGACRLPSGRGTQCTADRQCLGALLCLGGRCTDRVGPGLACAWFGGEDPPYGCDRVHTCQLPLDCAEGICVLDHPPGLGQPCAMAGCCSNRYAMGRCSAGFCGHESVESMGGPYVCRPVSALGETCNPRDQAFGACPEDATCMDGGAGYRCVANLGLGDACDPEPCSPLSSCLPRCDPEVAFCGPDGTCWFKSTLSWPCGETSDCQILRPNLDVECRGRCENGEHDGKPCTSAAHCGEGRCAGHCTDMNEPWSMCDPG